MKILLAIIACALLTGCNTLGDAKASRGKGTTRTFPAPFEQVWAVIPPAANELDLSIAGSYKEEGYILAERGATMVSWGERVAIFVNAKGPSTTDVEVVSKRAVAGNIFATDFEPSLLNRIGQKLQIPK